MLKKYSIFILIFITFVYATLAISDNTAIPQDPNHALQQLYAKYKTLQAGKNASYIPELAKVNPQYFAIAIATVDGKLFTIGDADVTFSIQSISKLFAYALLLQDNGEKFAAEKIGLNATGRPFNSVISIEEQPNHLQNPLVNSGAIQVTSAIKGRSSAEKWQRVLNLMQQLSDGKLYLGNAVYQSEMATNQHNKAIAELLASYGMMYSDPLDAVDRYTKACSVMVTTKQLALMGATLANGGVNPLTHQRVISTQYVRNVLAEMVVNGLYENSGLWWTQVGVPSKGAVGGGFITVIPNHMAIAVFSPPLDSAGNSVRAQAVVSELSQLWNLHLLSVK